MTTEPTSTEQERPKQKVIYRNAASAPVHGFGLIGAWVYYLTHSATFWIGALGILKRDSLACNVGLRANEISAHVDLDAIAMEELTCR